MKNNELFEEELDLVNKMDQIAKESLPEKEQQAVDNIVQFPSNNGKLERTKAEITETGEEQKVMVKVDPNSGEHAVLGPIGDESTSKKSIDEIFDMDIDANIDLDKSPISREEFDTALESSKKMGTLADFANFELSEESTLKLVDLVNHRMVDENYPVYRNYPDELKDMINKYVISMGIPILSKQAKTMRNSISEMIIDEFISDTQANRIQKDFNSEIESLFEKSGNEIASTVIGYTSDRNNQYRKYAEGLEDEEKKQKILSILDTIDEAYKLTELKEFSKKCKIKKFELEKPERIYDTIMQKYEKSTYNIYDIKMAIPILFRNLNEGKENFEYLEKHVIAFFLAFCKQCINKKIEVVTDHAYMYYVLYNVVLMDINKGKEKEVSEGFKNNVIEVIENLKNRNDILR